MPAFLLLLLLLLVCVCFFFFFVAVVVFAFVSCCCLSRSLVLMPAFACSCLSRYPFFQFDKDNEEVNKRWRVFSFLLSYETFHFGKAQLNSDCRVWREASFCCFFLLFACLDVCTPIHPSLSEPVPTKCHSKHGSRVKPRFVILCLSA